MATDDPVMLRRRKAHHLADQLGFCREDRLDLARVLLWRDVNSWSDLNDSEIRRLLDAMEGHALISFVRSGGAWTDLPHPQTASTA